MNANTIPIDIRGQISSADLLQLAARYAPGGALVVTRTTLHVESMQAGDERAATRICAFAPAAAWVLLPSTRGGHFIAQAPVTVNA